MATTSAFFLVVWIACFMNIGTVGFNYYWQANPGKQELVFYQFLKPDSAVWKQDCDKSATSGEGGSGEDSKSTSSEENSSEITRKDSMESKEVGGSDDSKGSMEEVRPTSKEESSKEIPKNSEDKKKEAPKKKKKKQQNTDFPSRAFNFPPRQVHRIIYSAIPPYAYLPYRSSYVVPSIASYPVKSSYQYVLPSSTVGDGGRSAALVKNKAVNSPVQRIIYSPSTVLRPVSKTDISPGVPVYSVSGTRSWDNPTDFLKK